MADKTADPPKLQEPTAKAPAGSPTQAGAPAAPPPAAAKASEEKEQETTKEPEETVLKAEDARSLFHAGHRLKEKGDPPEKWIAATRVRGVLCLAMPVSEELEKELLEKELVLLPD